MEVKTRRENYTDVTPCEKPNVKKRELNIPKTSYEMVDHIKTEEVRYVYMYSHSSFMPIVTIEVHVCIPIILLSISVGS